MYSIGVDVGGHKIMAVLVDSKGKVHKSVKVSTPRTRAKILHRIQDSVFALGRGKKIKKIGIGIAGVLDKKREKMINSPNLTFLNGWKLKKDIQKTLRKQVVIENDANCFAFAAQRLEFKEHKNIAVLTLGTGLGCGLVLDGGLFVGNGKASEAGHMKIAIMNGKAIEAEELIGTKGVIKRASAKGLKVRDAYELGEKSKKSKKALSIIEETGVLTAIVAANLFDILDVETVVLSGGLLKMNKSLERSAKKYAKKFSFTGGKKITVSKLGETGSAVGAALLAMRT